MQRMTTKETLVKKPELIRVRLVADTSGSMFEDSGQKFETLKRTTVLLLSSLREFNSYLNLTRRQTGSKLTVDTEVRIFGSSSRLVKPLDGSRAGGTDDGAMINAVSQLGQNLSGTADSIPFSHIEQSLTPADLKKIKEKRILEIVFEITDGGTGTPEETRTIVDNWTDEKGIVVRAFQIGRVGEIEKQLFHQVWNDGRAEPRGEVVGTDLSRLAPAITLALKKYLGDVSL